MSPLDMSNLHCYQELRNTIGNIPVEWYNEYPHIGYDLRGEKILKPATGDEVNDDDIMSIIVGISIFLIWFVIFILC